MHAAYAGDREQVPPTSLRPRLGPRADAGTPRADPTLASWLAARAPLVEPTRSAGTSRSRRSSARNRSRSWAGVSPR